MLPRAIARMLLLIGPALVLAGFALNPWLLERYVLLDGNLDHGRAVLAAEIALVLLGLLALGAGRRARSAPAELSARRATFIAVTLAGSLLLALGLGEVALRVLLGPERLLHGEALWEYRWRAAHVPAIGPRPMTHAFDR